MSIANKNNLLTELFIDTVSKASAFVFDKIAPALPVSARTFRYPVLTAGNLSRNTAVAVSADGETLRSTYSTTNAAAYIDREFRNQQLVSNADGDEHPDGMDGAIRDASAVLARRVGLEAEIALNTVLGTITANGAAVAAWGGALATPLVDIQAAVASVRAGSYGQLCNQIVMPYGAYQRFILDQSVIDFVAGRGSISGALKQTDVEAALSRMVGGPVQIVIPGALYDVSGTATSVYADTSGAAVVYALHQETERAGIRAVTQFSLRTAEGVFTGPDTEPASRGTWVEGKLVRKPVLTFDGAGYRITGV